MTTPGSRLKTIRMELKLSQDEMGKIFNASKSYISQIENDKCNFSISQLIKLLLEYNVNINFLLGGIGSHFIKSDYGNMQNEILSDIKQILENRGIK